MDVFDHLHASTIPLLDLPLSERKRKAETKRWIPYPAARDGYAKMQRLLDLPRQQRPENLLVMASTANGKSMMLERFAQNNPARDNEEGESAIAPVLRIEIPEDPTLDGVYFQILDRLFTPLNGLSTKNVRRREAFRMLSQCQVKMLLVDEVHNLALAGTAERLKILAFLRAVGNDPDVRAHIVCAGTREARRMLQRDDQLLNRYDIHALPIWRDGRAFRELLASFEALMPLRQPSGLGDDDGIASAILTRSEGLIGEMFKIVSRAAVHALESGGERITLKTLSKIDYQSPTAKLVHIEEV